MKIDKSKPVLVTGATGYVAGRLVERLLQEGITVHAAVRDPHNEKKLSYLNELAAKLPGNIKYFKADLLDEGSYDEAMNGCELVYHTASPFVRNVKDPQLDLVDPAKQGTRNVLESANRTDSVKKVVVTSSCAAMFGDGADLKDAPNHAFNEDRWNTSSSLSHQPYSFSKVEAEKEAWNIAKNQDRWELVTVNPSLVLGPAINPHATSESFSILEQVGKGDFKFGTPDYAVGAVDVRDLAQGHFQAGFNENASGRYILSGADTSFKELVGAVKKKFPNYPMSTRKLPKWMLWLLAPTVGMTRKEVSLNVGHAWHPVNAKSVEDLGMNYRPIESTITEMFEQMVEAGRIPKR